MALSRLESLEIDAHALHNQTQLPIAAAPRLYVDGYSLRILGIADRFSLEDLVEFAAKAHDRDPNELKALGVLLHNGSRRIRGGLDPGPVTRQDDGKDVIHYPFIRLRVPPILPVSCLNLAVRHDVRHVFQPDVPPLYSDPRAVRIASTVGGVIAGAGLVSGAFHNGQTVPGPEILNDFAELVVGYSTLAAFTGRAALAMFSAQEYDANNFAINTDFRAIS
jgi:hypothetical protein